MSAVWPSITEGFPTTHSNYPQIIMIQIPCKHLPAVSLTLSTYHIKGKLSTFNSQNLKIVKKFTPYNDSRVQNLIFTIVNCDQCLKNPILVSKLSLIIITHFQKQKFYNISFFFVSLYFPTNYPTI